MDDVRSFASEFNVRKRMVPRAVVFSSRARMVEVIRLEGEITEEGVEAAVREALASIIEETPEGKRWKKHTLAIGGAGDKEEV